MKPHWRERVRGGVGEESENNLKDHIWGAPLPLRIPKGCWALHCHTLDVRQMCTPTKVETYQSPLVNMVHSDQWASGWVCRRWPGDKKEGSRAAWTPEGVHGNQDILSGHQHQCQGVAVFRGPKTATKSHHTADHMWKRLRLPLKEDGKERGGLWRCGHYKGYGTCT